MHRASLSPQQQNKCWQRWFRSDESTQWFYGFPIMTIMEHMNKSLFPWLSSIVLTINIRQHVLFFRIDSYSKVGERFLLLYVWFMRAWKLCVRTEKALARPCFCAGSSDPLLLALIKTSDPYNTAWLASFYIRSYMDGHQWKFSWRTTNFSGVQHVLA